MARLSVFGLRIFSAAVVLAAGIGATSAQTPAHKLFGDHAVPSDHQSEPFGTYNKGCLAGGVELPETGPAWQAMRLSRNRNWGHKDAIAFIERLSAKAQELGWPRLLIGDIGQPRGGPMRSGHRSHQIGIDIDIWMRKSREKPYSRKERETISSVRVVASDNRSIASYWTPEHHEILKAASKDGAVARIFVNAAIKNQMCRDEPAGNRGWLRKIRPWYGHDYHFHVRLKCPGDSPGCKGQAAPPAGDGCGESLNWWHMAEKKAKQATRALKINPGAGEKPKPKYITLADLPTACRIVLEE